MYSFEKLKAALKRREEERYEALKKEVKTLRQRIEEALEMFFESTASQAQTRYSGLEMH